ncbi:hypothetical protein HNQ91_003206 [Filimonas zeae]|uniref:Uncharacterized protein n=1 Tax=Filimonas zeae TaxID=1737353 RepID=A0A917J222_9BACT|nr:hypothetical protein [Filimonas zeae]GGH71336.1 hypothetical protein GCM10011379_30570 [Filimonas zeae]
MNKLLKFAIIILSCVTLYFSVQWYIHEKSYEPMISIIANIIALLGLFAEKKVTNFITRDIDNNSDIDIDTRTEGNVTTERIKNSKIRIKSR